MTLAKFITRTAIKIIMFASLLIVIAVIVQFMSPVVSNEMALTQMQNSNELFVFVNTYNRVRPIFMVVLSIITILFTCAIACDTYNFIKNQKEKT